MAIKNFDAIVADIINNIQIVNPIVDVKIGEVVRDIFIDIQALQLESLYVIADNSSKAQSITTALGQQLDRIAYNYNTKRKPATRSTGTLIIEIANGIDAPTPLNIGDQYFTKATVNSPSVIFLNTQYQILTPGTTQATVQIVALNPGVTGNVAANAISESSYDFATAVYNPQPTEGGKPPESDPQLAFRLPYQVTGSYVNTVAGVVNALLNVSNVRNAPYFVTPDSPLSRGPYTLDVYLQRSAGYYGTAVQETAPANAQDYIFQQQPLYELEPINQITVYDPINNTTTLVDASQYEVWFYDPADVYQFNKGTVKANAKLHWVTAPPSYPYTISYNIDSTVADAQSNYDKYNEMTADTLFKQAPALPIYISAKLAAANGSNNTTSYNTAKGNLLGLFNNVQISDAMTDKDVEYTFLQDQNLLDVTLTNFDTTVQITLNIPANSAFITPNVQSQVTPLGYYWESDVTSPVAFYNIAGRLWMGKKSLINSANFTPGTGFNLVANNDTGVKSQDIVQNVTPSWQTNVLPYYDPSSETLVLNFTSAPPASGGTVTFNLVQNLITTIDSLSYLTLAPSLVSPVSQYTPTIPNAVPLYATMLPEGLTMKNAILYKNGVALTPTTSTSIGDYTIVSGPDPSTGLINIQFTQTPASTDVFQFGLLNPNLTITVAPSYYVR